jgi:predicted CopG family antitoxin
MSARKTIQVDEDVWLQLVHLKYQLRARSISEVLRQILQNCKNVETQSYKAGAGQAVQVSTGQVVKVPPGQSTTVPSGQVTAGA